MSDIEIIQTPRVMLSVTEAAKCLSIGRSTLYELINSGEIEERAHRPTASRAGRLPARVRRAVPPPAGRRGAVTPWAPERATSGRRSS